MSEVLEDVNKIVVIDKCIMLLIRYCKSSSNFLGNTLESNYNSYKEEKKKKYLNNINSNLEKIADKENNEELFNKSINDIKTFIRACYKKELLDSSYSRYLDSLLNGNIKDIFKNYLKEYSSFYKEDKPVSKEVKKKKNVTKVILPKISEEVKQEISYLKINDLIYMHMRASSEFPFMEFSKESFDLEIKKYNDCIVNNELTIFDDLTKYELSKLAPVEKKRRNYVRSMFNTESKIYNLQYDTEEYFKISLDIVNNLYIEMNDFDDNNASIDRLIRATKLAYGGKRQLESYKNKFNNLDIDLLVNCNFLDRYNILSDIKTPIPSYEDIIRVLNNKIIERVSFNIENYIDNVDKLFYNICEYMNIDDVIKFYYEIKNVLNINSLYKSNSKYLISLQKYCVLYLYSKFNIDEEEILRNYLKEERIY